MISNFNFESKRVQRVKHLVLKRERKIHVNNKHGLNKYSKGDKK